MPRMESSSYDAAIKRWRAFCPYCAYQAVRAKREAAEHVVSQHVNYTHSETRS